MTFGRDDPEQEGCLGQVSAEQCGMGQQEDCQQPSAREGSCMNLKANKLAAK